MIKVTTSEDGKIQEISGDARLIDAFGKIIGCSAADALKAFLATGDYKRLVGADVKIVDDVIKFTNYHTLTISNDVVRLGASLVRDSTKNMAKMLVVLGEMPSAQTIRFLLYND